MPKLEEENKSLKLKLKQLIEEEKKEPPQRSSSAISTSNSKLQSAKKDQKGR